MDNCKKEEDNIHPIRRKYADLWTRLVQIQVEAHEIKHAHLSKLEKQAFVEQLIGIEGCLSEAIGALEELVQCWNDLLASEKDFEDGHYAG